MGIIFCELPYYACRDGFIKKAIDAAILSENIKIVMLSGYAVWKIRPTDDDLHLKNLPEQEIEESAGAFKTALNKTLAYLVASGKKIVFFVDTPVLNFEPTECIAIRPVYFKNHMHKTPCAFPRALFDQRNLEYHRIIGEAKTAFPTVQFINAYEYLCDQELCYAFKEGLLLYMDHSHLSANGSRYLLGKMAHELQF